LNLHLLGLWQNAELAAISAPIVPVADAGLAIAGYCQLKLFGDVFSALYHI
jgi:hypothetical protein